MAFASDVPIANVALVHVATFTAESPAEGWYAWKRQSQEYKKAHPWEGANGVWCANSTRLSIPCTEAAWKKVPLGTLFLLPAPEVQVYVPEGATPPKFVMLRPTAEPQLLAPDLSISTAHQEQVVEAATLSVREQNAKLALSAKMHKTLNGVLLIVVAACLLFGLWMSYCHEKACVNLAHKEVELLELKKEMKFSRSIPVLVDVVPPDPVT
jgi:hypothetical protein